LHADTTINPKNTPVDDTCQVRAAYAVSTAAVTAHAVRVLNRPTHADRSEITSCPGCTNFFVVISGSNLSVAPDFLSMNTTRKESDPG